jgi:chlorite dismutase
MKNGQPQRSDERLFMQLLVYGGCRDSRAVSAALSGAGVEGAIYEDANDPQGIASCRSRQIRISFSTPCGRC